MIAASAGHEQVVSFLLAKGAQVNAVNNTGQCSLHYAASKDRYQVNINIHGIYTYSCTIMQAIIYGKMQFDSGYLSMNV